MIAARQRTPDVKAREYAAADRRLIAQRLVVDLLRTADLTALQLYRATGRSNVTRASMVRAIRTLTTRGRVGNREVNGVRVYFLRTWQ